MKLLITGGAGFIGSNLARYITDHAPSIYVTVLDDLSSGAIQNIAGLPVNFIEGTILDNDKLIEAAKGADAIVHLAAIPSVPRSIRAPRPSHDANITGTLNVLEAARNGSTKQVIVASSSSVYGSNPKLPKSERDWTRPMSPYAVTKQATEAYAVAYGFSYGLRTLAFRFFNVYGPGQAAGHAYAAVIPQFIDAALSGRPLPITGNGNQSRDFTYVDTVCATILQALLDEATLSDPVNLAFGTNTDLNTLVSMLEGVIDEKLGVEYIESRVGDVKASQADSSLIKELFPEIQPVGLREGLVETVKWFRAKSALQNG